MNYVALLRGINVGGNRKVEMKKLAQLFENLGLAQVKTYINSGNVIFSDTKHSQRELEQMIEKGIEETFGFAVPTILVSHAQLAKIGHALPKSWTNDQEMRCDVLFLWDEIDSKATLSQLQFDPDNEDVVYVKGAILWRVDRSYLTRSTMLKIAGTKLYSKMTIRNCNTVRKLLALMQSQ